MTNIKTPQIKVPELQEELKSNIHFRMHAADRNALRNKVVSN